MIAKITPSLPRNCVQDKDEFVATLRKAAAEFTVPPGDCIESYSVIVRDGTTPARKRYYEIYECKLEDNEPSQKLLANLQTLSLWFIEGLVWFIFCVVTI